MWLRVHIGKSQVLGNFTLRAVIQITNRCPHGGIERLLPAHFILYF
jgi:hypothetical protein